MENLIDNVWHKSKLLVKGFIIGILILLLMIPVSYVQNLVQEREARQKEAFVEVSSKWAGKQNVTGPVLVIPYHETKMDEKNKPVTVKKLAYFLPAELQIQADVKPEKRYRGIYEVMLYSSEISMNGKFSGIATELLKIPATDFVWNEAYVNMGIPDARGLKDELQIIWNSTDLKPEPVAINNGIFKEGFVAPVSISENDVAKEISFSTQIKLNGSEQLLFTPIGKETNVKITSAWPDPSFTGGQLPETTSITDKGFTASWKSFSHKRNFPQVWKDAEYDLSSASFGVDLFIPVSGYQKTMRSVKYAILCILLTFAAFFLIETVNKKSVHPFQYALIGLALILFYTLLLSISEYTGFNIAYAIASVATIALIGWFVKGLLHSGKLSTLLSVILVIMYGYVFTILQLQDYALLLGSVGLFCTLAIIMYYSKRIGW
ncbi:MAG TPA: cell envelope integrity protein CreD [Chitinophagaceae bacterium]|jgi:Inner membrane protein involved in colicin E2 resistance